jgi:hypothetical protein
MSPLPPNDLSSVEAWDEPKPWWQRRTGITAIAAALVLLGGGLYYGLRPASASCGDGLARIGSDHTCVGLTDGSHGFHFTDNLKDVSDKIAAVNDQIKKGRDPWVSVVYMLPMVPGPGGSTTVDSVRHEIEGAYIAQWVADFTNDDGDSPKIRVLLANPGTGSPDVESDAEQDYMLGQIKGHIDSDHIVAVAGLGTSTNRTFHAINTIIDDKLATFASVMTADNFTPAAGQGLVRVAPPNSDEVAAAGAYLRSALTDPSHNKVQLIEDTNGGDDYTKTLGDEFRGSYPNVLPQTMTYNSNEEGVGTNLYNQMANLCEARPAAVYFAGRGIDLPKLLGPLSQRPCANDPLIVMAGDDASQLVQSKGKDEVQQDLKVGNIRLLFTGLANDGAWGLKPQPQPHTYSQSAYKYFVAGSPGGGEFPSDFPQEKLTDGQAIMGHDAMLAAVMAIRDAVPAGTPANGVDGSKVIQILPTLWGKKAIQGASGLISLNDTDPKGQIKVGYPNEKAIPIIEFDQYGSVTARNVSSKDGQPLQFPQ